VDDFARFRRFISGCIEGGHLGIYFPLLLEPGALEVLVFAYDGLKAKGLSISSGVIDAVVSLGVAAFLAYSEAKTLGPHVIFQVGNETSEGIREGISELSLANRTRGTFRALTRFADSVLECISELSLANRTRGTLGWLLRGGPQGADLLDCHEIWTNESRPKVFFRSAFRGVCRLNA
jgi:hypothetical protein